MEKKETLMAMHETVEVEGRNEAHRLAAWSLAIQKRISKRGKRPQENMSSCLSKLLRPLAQTAG